MRPLVLTLLTAFASGFASAEERLPGAQPSPFPIGAPPQRLDSTPHTVPLGRDRAPSAPTRPDPKLGPVRAVRIQEGEATLLLPSGTVTVHPGDVVAGDTVKIVEPARLVLTRPDPAGGPPGIVIVRFDEKGRGHVAVFSARDTSPAAPPLPASQ